MTFSVLNVERTVFDRSTHWINKSGVDVTLSGCNLKCLGCMSKAQTRIKGKQYHAPELGKKIFSFFGLQNNKRVYIHGGEVFTAGIDEVIELISILVDDNIRVTVESHGCLDLAKFFDYSGFFEDYFTFVLKVPLLNTGMFEYFVKNNLLRLKEKDVLLLRIRTDEDIKLVKDLIFSFEDKPIIDLHVNKFNLSLINKLVSDEDLKNVDYCLKFI